MRTGRLLLALALAVGALALSAGTAHGASKIVYDAFSADAFDVFSINSDGTGRRKLTRGVSLPEFDPSWAPNRRRIVYSRRGRLFVMRANGTRKRRIRKTRFASQPAWSPDGKRIAYTVAGGDGGTDFIYTIRPNGKGRKRLGRGAEPAWSPSGKSIFYSSNGVRRMRANGSRKRLVLPNASGPNVSPDGESLAFVREARIWVAEIDGSDPFIVTTGLPDGCEIDPDDCGREDDAPVWSPSGNRIAYTQLFPAGSDAEGIHTIRPTSATGDRLVARGGQSPDW
jgi:TolB protein